MNLKVGDLAQVVGTESVVRIKAVWVEKGLVMALGDKGGPFGVEFKLPVTGFKRIDE